MKIETKEKTVGNSRNLKPYIIIGVGVLVVLVSVYQLMSDAPGNLLESRLDKNASQEAKNPGSTKKGIEDSSVVQNIDSDSDGLTDTEEEQIYQTNALKPDTDLDGYKDGDEIAAGFDPRVNESGTQVSASDASSDYYDYNRFVADSPDDLSKLDPTQYLSEEDQKKIQNGEVPDVEKLSSLVLANTAISEDEVLPNIPDSDLNIIEGTGKAPVQQYVFAAGALILQFTPALGQQELTNYTTAALSGDDAKVRELIRSATSTEKELKKVPVPREMVDIHKRALGIMQVFQQAASTLLKAGTINPAEGLVATNQIRIISRATDDLMNDAFDITEKYGIELSL